jgi:CHASE3 domain sensor protein
MSEFLLVPMLLLVLVVGASLYWLRVNEQTRNRRIQERLSEIRHVTAVLRASIAEGRRFA